MSEPRDLEEYARLRAERDRLIGAGVDPLELEEPEIPDPPVRYRLAEPAILVDGRSSSSPTMALGCTMLAVAFGFGWLLGWAWDDLVAWLLP